MSTLAHVVQVAICGSAVAGALVFLAAHWIHDALHPSMSALLGLGGEQLPDDDTLCGWCGGGGCDECDPDRRYDPGEPGPCARHWTADGSPCGCDPDEDDPGAAWDRAHDHWTDGQLGVEAVRRG